MYPVKTGENRDKRPTKLRNGLYFSTTPTDHVGWLLVHSAACPTPPSDLVSHVQAIKEEWIGYTHDGGHAGLARNAFLGWVYVCGCRRQASSQPHTTAIHHHDHHTQHATMPPHPYKSPSPPLFGSASRPCLFPRALAASRLPLSVTYLASPHPPTTSTLPTPNIHQPPTSNHQAQPHYTTLPTINYPISIHPHRTPPHTLRDLGKRNVPNSPPLEHCSGTFRTVPSYPRNTPPSTICLGTTAPLALS